MFLNSDNLYFTIRRGNINFFIDLGITRRGFVTCKDAWIQMTYRREKYKRSQCLTAYMTQKSAGKKISRANPTKIEIPRSGKVVRST